MPPLHSEDRVLEEPSPVAGAGLDGMAAMLSAALDQRSKTMHSSAESGESGSEGEEEWSD